MTRHHVSCLSGRHLCLTTKSRLIESSVILDSDETLTLRKKAERTSHVVRPSLRQRGVSNVTGCLLTVLWPRWYTTLLAKTLSTRCYSYIATRSEDKWCRWHGTDMERTAYMSWHIATIAFITGALLPGRPVVSIRMLSHYWLFTHIIDDISLLLNDTATNISDDNCQQKISSNRN